MKIHISYSPQEELKAEALFMAARQLLPQAKVRRINTKPPYNHLYLTSRNHQKPHETAESD